MFHWNFVIVSHATCATVSLILGAFNLLYERKGSRVHKTIGYIWTLCMYWTIISSFWIREINHGKFSLIHFLSVFTFFSLTMGIYAAKKHNIKAHKGFMRGSYFGLLGAFVGALVVPVRTIPQFASQYPILLLLIVGMILVTVGTIIGAVLQFVGDKDKIVGG
jgi:uncharacterized membrane protein